MAIIPGVPQVNEGIDAEVKVSETITNLYSDVEQGIPPAPGEIGTGAPPVYSTGARALIKSGGRPIGVCRNISWVVGFNTQPIYTIDSNAPWDVDVGQISIQVTLEKIINPLVSLESEGLFPITQAAPHQPLVELQVLDASGTSLFFARGVFTEIRGNVSVGQLSSHSAKFIGTSYQGYVQQNFSPYGASGLNAKATNLVQSLSGLKTSG